MTQSKQAPFVRSEYATIPPRPIPFVLALMYRRVVMQPRFGIVHAGT